VISSLFLTFFQDCNQQITNHYKKDPTDVFPDISNFVIQLIDILKVLPLNLDVDVSTLQIFIDQH
jgi:hypothetical protein